MMGNTISFINHNAPQNSSHLSFNDNIELNDLSTRNKSITDIFPIEILENIINFYALAIECNSNSLLTIMLICKKFKKICDNLREIDSNFGKIINLSHGLRYWEKIEESLNYPFINSEEFRKEINYILDNTSYIRIVFPMILDDEKRSIVFETLFSKKHLKYLDLYTDLIDFNLDLFFNEFTKFLNANIELKFFGILYLDFQNSNESHTNMLLPLLKGKIFRAIYFDFNKTERKGIDALTKIFPTRYISEEYSCVVLGGEDNLIPLIKQLDAYCMKAIITALKKRAKIKRRELDRLRIEQQLIRENLFEA